MANNSYRNTWIEINLAAIGYNIEQLKANLPKGSKAMAVVKANAYGHGSVEVAKMAVQSGIDFLMVALLEEAMELRKQGIRLPILVIGRTSPAYAHVAAEHAITLTVFQEAWLHEVAAINLPKPLDIHLEVETGMGRTGICSQEELSQIIKVAEADACIRITGIYTHFATADEEASPFYREQQTRFQAMLQAFRSVHEAEVIVHTGNSAAGMQYPKDMADYTRFGIATYGLYPSPIMKEMHQVDLKPAFSLYSELMQVKRIAAGETIGYGRTYTAKETQWIGTIPIGYGDGWRRDLQGFHVLIDGKRAPIVGRICMDQIMVRLDKPYPIGEKVTLIGKNGGEEITADDIAAYLDTISYEVTCMLSERIPRKYPTGH